MSDPISDPMSDNEALRRIVASLDELVAILAGDYENISGDNEVEVTDELMTIRGSEDTALKTVVTNLTDKVVYIYEGGFLVATLYLEETWESVLGGRKSITAKCKETGETSTLAIATYLP